MVHLTKGRKFIFLAVAFFVLAGVVFAYKAGRTITVVGGGNSELWADTISDFSRFPDPEENRIDILLVGIRGFDEGAQNIYEGENGEYLADTLILASFNKDNGKAAIVSIPRDLYVEVPDYGMEKINAAYAVGESRHYGGGGLQLAKALVSMISGVYVDYALSVDFEGFKKVIDHIGGIVIYRDSEFVEDKQWIYDGREGSAYWELRGESTTTPAGWVFRVPSGANTMNSEEALYYARSRYSSSDFDRMHRQQEVISAVKSKALNLGVIANPVKVFNILDTLADNLRTDMSLSQMKDLLSLIREAEIRNFERVVLDTSEGGFLVEERIEGKFVLLPKGGDFSQIKDLFANIVETSE